MYTDNTAAASWTIARTSMRRMKHIEVRKGGIALPQTILSVENPADGFTKPFDKTKFEKFRSLIGINKLS